MPLFGRKKVEEKIPEEFKELIEKPEPVKEEIVKPTVAPLFVKLERYGNILEAINEIKMTVLKIKNALTILSDLDNLRNENLKLIKDATDAMESRVGLLDSEFLKPSGLEEKLPPEVYAEGLEDVLDNLKTQVGQLKAELESIS
jgi:hypothetical protein